VCSFHCGELLDKYFDILWRADISQIKREIYALPLCLKAAGRCIYTADFFLEGTEKYIEKHFSSTPELAVTSTCFDRVTAYVFGLQRESDSSGNIQPTPRSNETFKKHSLAPDLSN
jgi:hypothetical protein